jgi:hypothetical protein
MREVLLGQTGHRYWSAAVAVAVVFGALAATGTVTRHLTNGARLEPSVRWWEGFRRSALGLVALQGSIFVVQEVVERLLAGAPVSGLLHGPFLMMGLAVQVLVAAAVALVLACLGRASEALGRAIAGAASSRRAASSFDLLRASFPAMPSRRGSRLTRGPPLRLPA